MRLFELVCQFAQDIVETGGRKNANGHRRLLRIRRTPDNRQVDYHTDEERDPKHLSQLSHTPKRRIDHTARANSVTSFFEAVKTGRLFST